MKQLFLAVFVVTLGILGCTFQIVPQQPESHDLSSCPRSATQAVSQQPESVPVQIPSAATTPATPKADKAMELEGCAEVEVNYDLKLAEILEGYEWVDDDVSRDIKKLQTKSRSTGTKLREVCWFKFNRQINMPIIRERIKASGRFLVADLWELHALGLVKPNLHKGFPLVAPGSFWPIENDFVSVPCICESYDIRALCLCMSGPGIGWYDRYRFVAVRK